jgi:aryl-alcohol dehydrogenase-like predicted oxidoreductase
MDNRRIGDLDVFPLGLGCMQLSGRRMIDRREQALATIHTALDAGITLLDTANIYAPDAARIGHNEELVAEAVSSYAGRRPVIATKGGITRVPGTDADVWGRAGTPDALLRAAEASATRLAVSPIWLAESETILCEKATYLSNLMADGKLTLICGLMDDSSMTCTEPYFIISGSPFTLGSRHMKFD